MQDVRNVIRILATFAGLLAMVTSMNGHLMAAGKHDGRGPDIAGR
jgi:hypothetical protein